MQATGDDAIGAESSLLNENLVVFNNVDAVRRRMPREPYRPKVSLSQEYINLPRVEVTQAEMIDRISRAGFPISFALFNLGYWLYYLYVIWGVSKENTSSFLATPTLLCFFLFSSLFYSLLAVFFEALPSFIIASCPSPVLSPTTARFLLAIKSSGVWDSHLFIFLFFFAPSHWLLFLRQCIPRLSPAALPTVDVK